VRDIGFFKSKMAARTRVILMSPPKRAAAALANAGLPAEFSMPEEFSRSRGRVKNFSAGEVLKNKQVLRALAPA